MAIWLSFLNPELCPAGLEPATCGLEVGSGRPTSSHEGPGSRARLGFPGHPPHERPPADAAIYGANRDKNTDKPFRRLNGRSLDRGAERPEDRIMVARVITDADDYLRRHLGNDLRYLLCAATEWHVALNSIAP